MRRSIVLILALAMVPSVVMAQSKGKHGPRTVVVRTTSYKSDCCWGNRWLMEPYAGVVKDVYDVSPDGDNTSALAGLKVGYLLGARTRVLANFAYSESDNVSNPGPLDNFYIYDNRWIFTTAGGEFDVVPGSTSATLGLQAGAAWRRVDLDDQVGSPLAPSEEDSGFSAHGVIIPSVSLRQRLSNRLTVAAGLQDNIFDVFDGPAQHGVAATLGITFR
jgi:hypothetical protein